MERTREKAIVVGIARTEADRTQLIEDLKELDRLLDTYGAHRVGTVIQVRDGISPSYYIGPGKARALASQRTEAGADLFVFDADLTPAQHKNLETAIGARVMDRCGLIIEIFSRHARTHEAQVQVELARNNYLLPRLTHAWNHFSRQRGGVVVRGAGETQLEVDRRMVRQRIRVLQKKLAQISRQRLTRRRGRANVYQVALVGYTNSGKSTLMNVLTQSDCPVEDRLFATLDSTVRTIRPPDQPRILLTDTVGFIRKLPPGLVASFKSTLEEVRAADLLLHVVDLSDPSFDKKISATQQVLEEMGIADRPCLLVFNKVDLLPAPTKLPAIVRSIHQGACCVSGTTLEGVTELKETIRSHFEGFWQDRQLVLRYGQTDLLSVMYGTTKVTGVDYQNDRIVVRFKASDREFGRLEAAARHRGGGDGARASVAPREVGRLRRVTSAGPDR